MWMQLLITLRLRQNDRHFTDNIFEGIFFNENASVLIEISLKFVPRSNYQYSSNCSDNDLAQTRRQAIIWTNDG